MGSRPNALEQAKTVLAGAKGFTSGVTKQAGNKENPFEPKADYVYAREARRAAAPPSHPYDGFMGIRSNQAPELNTALQTREEARKALIQ